MGLIHDAAFFTEESVKRRATKYGFANNLAVEIFLWDCEIAAQLQTHSESLILKGGAATQLHLPVEMQRGSIDIDMVGPLTETEVEEIVALIPSNLPSVSFERYFPKSPIPRIPLITYQGKIPTLIPERRTSDITIKTEFLLEDIGLDHSTLPEAPTFAIEAKNIKCYSVPSLIGDKLLTLARNTIGVTREEDVPKQIYDIATLSELHVPSSDEFSLIADAINKLIPIEAGYRGLHLDTKDVLNDIQTSLKQYSLLDTSGGNRQIWNNITSFQQFYVNSSQRKNRDEWSERAWRLRFLSELIASISEGESVHAQATKYSSALTMSKKLREIKGEKIVETRKELLKYARPHTPFFKELRGKSLNRVFWQIIDRDNIEAVQSSL